MKLLHERNHKIEELIGKTLSAVQKDERDSELLFITENDGQYLMFHDQSCCEKVWLEDISGDLNDLVGMPILKASEDTNSFSDFEHDVDMPPLEDNHHSYTWTFYNLATIKGTVTLRWYGTSNGYYSEAVNFIKVSEIYDDFDVALDASRLLGKDFHIPVGTEEKGFRFYY